MQARPFRSVNSNGQPAPTKPPRPSFMQPVQTLVSPRFSPLVSNTLSSDSMNTRGVPSVTSSVPPISPRHRPPLISRTQSTPSLVNCTNSPPPLPRTRSPGMPSPPTSTAGTLDNTPVPHSHRVPPPARPFITPTVSPEKR